MSNKLKGKLLLGVLVTAVVIYFIVKALGGLDLRSLAHLHIDWFLVAVSVGLNIYANYVRSLGYTLGIDPKIDRLTAFRIVGIGHAANMILPLHIGDGLRLLFFPGDYSAARRTKLVAIPGFVDFVAIMLLSVLAVPFAGFRDRRLLSALWLLTALCVALIVLAVALVFIVPRLRAYFAEYLNAGLVKMSLLVALSWALMLVATWLGLAAFGFPLQRALRMSFAVYAATNIIGFIPASPGSIGLFEYGVILGLQGLNVGAAQALPAGLLLHLIQYLAQLPPGIILYVSALKGRHGQELKKLMHMGK